MSYGGWGWRPYVSVGARRLKAARALEKLKKKKTGAAVSPVILEGRKIATTFWGKAWCENLERYSDFANRLPRGRSYLRNGLVVDLQVEPGSVLARVCGSSLYTVKVKVAEVPQARWEAICRDCAGAIDSLVELLQGRLSKGVMERICREPDGLFPAPKEIDFDCSCPDGAYLCKHVAAVLYGVGARMDAQPALLFRLRRVDEQALIAGAAAGVPLAKRGPAAGKVLQESDLGAVFGIELAGAAAAGSGPAAGGPEAGEAAGGEVVAAQARRVRVRKPARGTRAGPAAKEKRGRGGASG